MSAYTYPGDLLALQSELDGLRARRAELMRSLPWSVEPMDAVSDTQRWRPYERPASPGYSAEEAAEWDELARREQQLAIAITTHPFWEGVAAEEQMAARSALKHAVPGAAFGGAADAAV
ncbi:hypothetical protein [Streptomyces silvensis]|uniref:Uncharacterized protein n=1 Tax=Streptomyces silvensis TaxID=1765722 RepID=A0A0W7X3X6_9ACTN|nr:hypothetical protein [Streptomyces silvensis]KUF17386.1 hypothetical protein AT728_16425 [Streptomyces silvensis]